MQASAPNLLVRAWLPGSFRNQRLGEVRKQRKKTIQSLQVSYRIARLRQVDVVVSLPDSPSGVAQVTSLRQAIIYANNNKKG